jgi:hypothetical protein
MRSWQTHFVAFISGEESLRECVDVLLICLAEGMLIWRNQDLTDFGPPHHHCEYIAMPVQKDYSLPSHKRVYTLQRSFMSKNQTQEHSEHLQRPGVVSRNKLVHHKLKYSKALHWPIH